MPAFLRLARHELGIQKQVCCLSLCCLCACALARVPGPLELFGRVVRSWTRNDRERTTIALPCARRTPFALPNTFARCARAQFNQSSDGRGQKTAPSLTARRAQTRVLPFIKRDHGHAAPFAEPSFIGSELCASVRVRLGSPAPERHEDQAPRACTLIAVQTPRRLGAVVSVYCRPRTVSTASARERVRRALPRQPTRPQGVPRQCSTTDVWRDGSRGHTSHPSRSGTTNSSSLWGCTIKMPAANGTELRERARWR